MKTIYHFLRLVGQDYYGKRIGVLFAYRLAIVFAEHHDEFKSWDTYE